MQEKSLEQIINYEIEDEETAAQYIEFLNSKQKQLEQQEEDLARTYAVEHEKMMETLPRSVKRKFLKASYSKKFLNKIGLKN